MIKVVPKPITDEVTAGVEAIPKKARANIMEVIGFSNLGGLYAAN